MAARKKQRSPSYPSIDLEAALDKARLVWDHQQKHAATGPTIIKDYWDLSLKGSPGKLALAALKKFGILEEAQGGKNKTFRLSGPAMLALLSDSEEKRLGARQKLALNPTIHSDLWDEYGGKLPATSTIRSWLILNKSFNQNVVDDFVAQYRSTLSYAGLMGSDKLSVDDGNDDDDDNGDGGEPETPFGSIFSKDLFGRMRAKEPPPKPQKRARSHRDLALPIGGGIDAHLRLPNPMTEDEWQLMEGILKAMRPGIVRPSAVKPGVYIQWEGGGQLQFEEPKKVVRVEGGYVFVEGSDTGIPLDEVTIKPSG